VRGPQVRRVERKSASKLVNIVQIRHRDEVEPPFTDWLQEAYELPDQLAARKTKTKTKTTQPRRRTSGSKAKPQRLRSRR
jgi:hypothetical protein